MKKKFCSDFISSVPNVLIRSSIFACKRLGRDRDFLTNKTMHCQANYSIVFTGYELNELDGQVFNALVRLSKMANIDPGEPLFIKRTDILREMRKHAEGESLEMVWRSVKRLKIATIEIILYDKARVAKREIAGSFVANYGHDDADEHKTFVVLDPIITALYEDDTTTIDFTKRQSLNSMLSRWLFDYISSNTSYIPLNLTILKDISGYPLSKAEFKRQIAISLEAIKDEAPNLFEEWEIEKNMLTIRRYGNAGLRKQTSDMSDSERLDAIIAELESEL